MSTEVIVYKEPQPIAVVTQILRGEKGADSQDNNRYYVKPIKGIYSSATGLVAGDRYILTSDITKVKVVGGVDEDFLDGATVSVINSSKTYLRKGLELLERDPLIRLTGTVRFYIATTGSNTTGDGTATKPWSTLSFALNAIARKYIFQGVNLFVTCGDGVYVSGLIRFPDFATAGTAFNQLTIEGNASNPESVEFQSNGVGGTFFDLNTFILRIFFKNITIRGSNLNQDLIRVFNSPYFYLDTSVVFKGQFRYGIVALASADINCTANARIILKDINCTAIAHATRSQINLSPGIISIPIGSSSQWEFFIDSTNYSTIQMSPDPLKYDIQGVVAGKKFHIEPRGQIFFGINAYSISLNFLPGSLDGQLDNGGVYDLKAYGVVTAIAPLQVDNDGRISIQNYVFTQNMNLAEWLIVHNLNKPYPSITIKDTSNETLIGEVTAIDNNTMRVNFNTPEMGTAYLS